MADLQKENELMRKQLATEKSARVKHEAQIFVPNEKIQWLLKQRFGSSSEKISPDQLGLFNESEEILANDSAEKEPETTPVKGHTRTRKPRVSIPDKFPLEDIIHDIPESEKVFWSSKTGHVSLKFCCLKD